jgi:hypothetical protein
VLGKNFQKLLEATPQLCVLVTPDCVILGTSFMLSVPLLVMPWILDVSRELTRNFDDM